MSSIENTASKNVKYEVDPAGPARLVVYVPGKKPHYMPWRANAQLAQYYDWDHAYKVARELRMT